MHTTLDPLHSTHCTAHTALDQGATRTTANRQVTADQRPTCTLRAGLAGACPGPGVDAYAWARRAERPGVLPRTARGATSELRGRSCAGGWFKWESRLGKGAEVTAWQTGAGVLGYTDPPLPVNMCSKYGMDMLRIHKGQIWTCYMDMLRIHKPHCSNQNHSDYYTRQLSAWQSQTCVSSSLRARPHVTPTRIQTQALRTWNFGSTTIRHPNTNRNVQ